MNTPKNLIKKQIKQYQFNMRSDYIRGVLDIATFDPVKNESVNNIEKIGIIVPGIKRFAGGHTSIARLGTYLERKGFQVDYISYVNQDSMEMRTIMKQNYKMVEGNCKGYRDICDDYDIIIATNWVSVYYAKLLRGYKIYFVQDYEPYFFEVGEEYVLAEQTYQFGFHIVSLGKWNIKEIHKNIESANIGIIDFIDFPYEPAEYEYKKRDFNEYKSKTKYVIAVYSKENGKRLHNIIEYILMNANETLKENGITLDVRFFGLNREFNVKIGTNLGKLSTDEMKKLYYEADFGMSASLTNISLVPLEMMASGLPIIEFKCGSFESFFSDNTAILIDFDYRNFVEQFTRSIKQPNMIENMCMKAKECIDLLSWNASCEQFYNILENVKANADL